MLADVGAERAVLGLVCKGGHDAYIDIADILLPSTFTVDSNKAIYKCVNHIFERDSTAQIDAVSVLSAAKTLGIDSFFASKLERDHLNSILSFPAQQANLLRFAKKIKKLEVTRDYLSLIRDIQKDLENVTGEEAIDEILNKAEGPIFDFSSAMNSGHNSEDVHIADGLDEYLDDLMANPNGNLGISTGYPIFDACIGGGLLRQSVTLVGARTKGGKSMFCDNVAFHVSFALNIPVLVLDTEMSQKDHWHRLLALVSHVPSDVIKRGIYTPEQKRKIMEAKKTLKASKYRYRNISGQDFDATMSFARRWLLKNVGYDEDGNMKDALIIYDYLKLVDGDGISNDMKEYQILGFHSSKLHNFSVKYDVAILSFIQLNRDGISKETTAAASGSDRILHNVSNFSILKQKSPEEIGQDGIENGNRKLIPLIARHGPAMDEGQYISMNLDGSIATLTEGLTSYDIRKKNKSDPDEFAHHEEFLKGEEDFT